MSNPCPAPAPAAAADDKTAGGKPGYVTAPGCTALVTGSSGLVGSRLVEMLLLRGAARVVCFDVAAPDGALRARFAEAAAAGGGGGGGAIYRCGPEEGDLTRREAVEAAFESAGPGRGVDVVYHIGALVGPYHDRSMYMDVNYRGSMHVLECCRKYGVPRLVYSSSPSTRFDGADIEGLREDQLRFPDKFLQLYAESKAYAEQEISKACCESLMTVSVAPHQVYGPRDSLFLPSLLETAGTGRLRIFGSGRNKISVCYVDNYCHGLMCGADALRPGSPALGKFYICTDGKEQYFWEIINRAAVAMGFADLNSKFKLPYWFLMGLAYCANIVGWVMGKKLKLNPFAVKMMVIHRYFSPELSERDLGYVPEFGFEESWDSTIEWFKKHWLPGFLEKSGRGGGKGTATTVTSGKKSD